MKTGLLIAGSNIAIISAITAVYGILAGNPQIVGVGLSGLIAGIAVAGAGTGGQEGPREAIVEALRLMLNSHSAILESLDLVNHTVTITGREQPLLIVAPSPVEENVDPGLGVAGGAPYLAIPISGIAEEVAPQPSTTEASLRNALSDILTIEYRIAGAVELEGNGDSVRVTILGLDNNVKTLRGYPLDPTVLLVMVLLHRLTGRGVVLTSYRSLGDGLELTARMV